MIFSSGDAVRHRERHPLLEEALDLGNDVVVVSRRRQLVRRTRHVHQAELRAGGRGQLGDLRRRAQCGHVVDERRARRQRALGDLRLHRVDGDRGRDAGGDQRLDHRHNPAQLLVGRDRFGAGAGRLAADVKDLGALRLQA